MFNSSENKKTMFFDKTDPDMLFGVGKLQIVKDGASKNKNYYGKAGVF
jgi:hypothetical protein